jgi:hypothetical protein
MCGDQRTPLECSRGYDRRKLNEPRRGSVTNASSRAILRLAKEANEISADAKPTSRAGELYRLVGPDSRCVGCHRRAVTVLRTGLAIGLRAADDESQRLPPASGYPGTGYPGAGPGGTGPGASVNPCRQALIPVFGRGASGPRHHDARVALFTNLAATVFGVPLTHLFPASSPMIGRQPCVDTPLSCRSKLTSYRPSHGAKLLPSDVSLRRRSSLRFLQTHHRS